MRSLYAVWLTVCSVASASAAKASCPNHTNLNAQRVSFLLQLAALDGKPWCRRSLVGITVHVTAITVLRDHPLAVPTAGAGCGLGCFRHTELQLVYTGRDANVNVARATACVDARNDEMGAAKEVDASNSQSATQALRSGRVQARSL